MATFINEKRMVNDTLFNYEKKFHSPMSRFIDKTQTYVTYFHIADDASTVDPGFNDINDYLGESSPLRYKRIEGLPIYGLDAIVLQIEDSDQGLDRNYEGDAVLINSTITPFQNDFFMIPSLKDFYIFRITAVNSDHIMTDNYYQISFVLEYVDRGKAMALNKQTVEKYQCIFENIGTERKCIVRSDTFEQIEKLNKMYDSIRDTYISLFYNERYNCFLGEIDGPCHLLYDPFQVEFMTNHDLLNRKNQLDVIVPTQQFTDSKRRIKYEHSIYRFFEKRELGLLQAFKFNMFLGANNPETAFALYADNNVQVVDIPSSKVLNASSMQIFSDEFVTAMKVNGPTETRYGKLLIDYIHDDNLTIDAIPLDLEDEMIALSADLEIFFIIPIILYIIQELIDRATVVEKNLTTIEV